MIRIYNTKLHSRLKKSIVIFTVIYLLFGINFIILDTVYAQKDRTKLDELKEKLERLRTPKKEDVNKQESEITTQENKKEEIEQLPGMVYIPPGEFIMGSNEDYDYESPKHIVYLKGFYIDKFEVTNAQYKRFIDATGHKPPIHWKNNTYPEKEKYYPVVNVSYNDAEAYAKWANKRLPTEEEWEKAARYTDGRRYPWGDDWKKGYANVRPLIWFGKLRPVGSFPNGVSPYGVYDMSGNVSELTSSFFKPYVGNVEPNPNYGENYRVVRGGCYRKTKSDAQTFRRHFISPNEVRPDVGFRCAK